MSYNRRPARAWASPIVLAKKKNGGVRFCVDFRRVNEVIRVKMLILYRALMTVTPNFVLPGNGPADLIRLPEMVRRTKSRCLKWSTGPFQAAQNGPTLPVLVR